MALDLSLRWPIPPGVAYTVTNRFSVDPAGYSKIWSGLCGHNGLDIAVAEGTPILACRPGRVTLKNAGSKGFGLYILVMDGVQTLTYAHLSEQSVADGTQVAAGQQIGKAGQTGTVTGPHLHLGWQVKGVKNACYLDYLPPELGLLAGGKAL